MEKDGGEAGVGASEQPEGHLEPNIRLICEECGEEIEPGRNRNARRFPKRFCSDVCRARSKNRARLDAVRKVGRTKVRQAKGPSKHAEAVSRAVFQAIVPLPERAECIIQACRNLGVTDEVQIRAALAQNGVDPGRIPSDVLQALLTGHAVEGQV